MDGTPFTSGGTVSSEGSHVWRVDSTDVVGNHASESRSFIIDLTPPSVAIAGVTDGLITNQDVTPLVTVLGASTSTVTLDGATYAGGIVTAEGVHRLQVDAADLAGNTTSVVVSFEIDKTPPVLLLSGVANGALVGGAVTLAWQATDRNLLTSSATLGASSIPSGTVVSQEGVWTWRVDALDAAGNAASETRTFTIDLTAPSITITGVSDGLLTSSNVQINVAVAELHPAQVTTTVDGVPFDSGDIVSTEGAHTLKVVAVDAAGNSATRTVSFTIDRTPPLLQLSGVLDGQAVNHLVTLSFSATDLHLAAVSSTLNGGAIASGALVAAPGNYTWVVQAQDGAGNQTVETRSFSIVLTAPVITISGVTGGQVTRGPVTPVVSVASSLAVTTGITLDGAAFQSGSAVVSEGAHVLSVRAVDSAGNVATASVSFAIDRTAPTLTVAGVASGALVKGPVTLTFSATDTSPVVVAATLDGVVVASGASVTSDGLHTLLVTATDAAGNVAQQTLAFTIDATPPTVVITGVTNGQVSAGPLTPNFTATDAHLASTSATLNGAAFLSGTSVSVPGSYLLVVVATDAVGNTTTSSTSFTISQPTGPGVCRDVSLHAVRSSVRPGNAFDAVASPAPTLRFALPATLTATAGAGTTEALLTFSRGGAATNCAYRGVVTSCRDGVGSTNLSLVSCSPGLAAGSVVVADAIRLSVTTRVPADVTVTLHESQPCTGDEVRPQFQFAACAYGDLAVTSNSSVDGNVAADGNVSVGQSGEVAGAVVAGGSVTRAGRAEIDGTVYYGGTASLGCLSGHGGCPPSQHLRPAPVVCSCGYDVAARLAEVANNNDNNLLQADPAIASRLVNGGLRMSNGFITLRGGRYSLASLDLSGGQVQVARGESVELFVTGDVKLGSSIDLDGRGQLLIVSGADSSRGGAVTLGPNRELRLKVYAPWADVTVQGSTWIDGALVAHDITFRGSSGLAAVDAQVSPPPLSCP